MKGFKQCANGHFFKEEFAECPYCPKSASGPAPEAKTQLSGSQDGPGVGDKTQLFMGSAPASAPVVNAPKRDLNKTFIQEVEEVESASGEVKEKVSQRATRKIVGWLISYTLDPMGIDFRLYEGNNTIGRNTGNDIIVSSDSSISGHHATLLYKKGKFYVKDEMAANGTFINGDEIEIGHPSELVDGDTLRLGNTEFKFKSPL